MSKRIVAISDAHYGLKSGGYDRTDEIHSVMMNAVDYAIGVKADLFVHAGDLGHTANPPSRIHGLWVECFERLNRAQIESRFLLGNHDLVHRENDPSGSLSPLVELDYPFVRAITRTDIEDLGDGVGILWLPYMSKSNIFGKASIDEFNGEFLEGNGETLSEFHTVIAFSHLNPPEYQPHEDVILRPIHSTIPDSIMKGSIRVDLIVNGHIHRPQTIRQNAPSLIVVGSPICTDFGDMLEKSFLDILVTPGKPPAVNRIPAGNIPLVELKFDFVDNEQQVFPLIESLPVAGAGVKVSIRATEDQIESLWVSEFEKKLREVAAFVRPIIPLVVRRRAERDESVIRSDMTDGEAIRAWIEDRKPTGGKLVLKCANKALEHSGD